MKATVTPRDEEGKVTVDVELTEDEVKEKIDAQFKELAKSRIPGFRPGRAPRKVLEQNFGGHEAIYAQITTDVVNEYGPLTADANDVIFLTNPEFDEELEPVADGEGYQFTMRGLVKPELTLTSAEPVEISLPDTTATDEEIDEQIETLRNYYYTIDDVDRPAEEHDYVEITMQATDEDDNPVKALTSRARLVELGSTALPAAVDAGIVGMSAGETKEFDAEIDEKDGYATLKGKTVHVKATVENVRAKKLPDVDDAFASEVGFDDAETMRAQIREQIVFQKSGGIDKLKERRSIEALAERVDDSLIPDEYVDTMRQDILRDFFTSLQEQGASFDQYLAQQGITADEFQSDLDEQARESAAQSLALDALFTAKGLEVTDADIDAEFERAGGEVDRETWEKSGRMAELREAMRRQKASEWLVENVVVTEESPADEGDAKSQEAKE